MVLIVENGSGVENANSYVTLDEAIEYAELRGKASKFEDTEKLEAWLVLATDYLETQFAFQGLPYWLDRLNWPRSGVVVNRVRVHYNAIPFAIKKAQIELALILADGKPIMPTDAPLETTPFVKREKVGPIETEYERNQIATGDPSAELASVYSIIRPFLSIGFRTYRA